MQYMTQNTRLTYILCFFIVVFYGYRIFLCICKHQLNRDYVFFSIQSL